MTPVKLGLIGCGRIARLTHLHAIRSNSDAATIVAIADPDAKARGAVRQRVPGSAEFESGADLIGSHDVDAVLIASPPSTHVQLALAALNAGRHVYLEKPMGCDLEEIRRLHAAWRDSGLVGMMGFNQRAHPLMARARSLIQSGTIGAPVMVQSTFAAAARELPEWKKRRASGGGALLDLASHHLDLIPWMLDSRITEVSATLTSRLTNDDNAMVSYRLSSSLNAQVAVSMTGSEVDRVEIVGDEGILRVNRFAHRIDVLPARRPRTVSQRVRSTLQALFQTPAQVRAAFRAADDPSYALGLRCFARAVRERIPVSPDFDDGLRNMLVLAAAAKSAMARGQFVVVDAIAEGRE